MQIRLLAQAAPILDLQAIQALPEEEKQAVFPARLEEREGGGARVSGFVRQGEEVFRVRLDVTAARAEVELKPMGELLGRDEIDEAVLALRSPDEIVRAAAALELAEKKEEILSIHISSGLSGTIQSARLGAKEVADAVIHHIDTLTLSGGERFQVLAAAFERKRDGLAALGSH